MVRVQGLVEGVGAKIVGVRRLGVGCKALWVGVGVLGARAGDEG